LIYDLLLPIYDFFVSIGVSVDGTPDLRNSWLSSGRDTRITTDLIRVNRRLSFGCAQDGACRYIREIQTCELAVVFDCRLVVGFGRLNLVAEVPNAQSGSVETYPDAPFPHALVRPAISSSPARRLCGWHRQAD
jgi:hypothetical protein